MIKEGCAREMRRLLDAGKSLSQSARMTDMDRKTARKYRDNVELPSSTPQQRDYRTRRDPFADVWDQVQHKLEADPKLKAYALFSWLQDSHQGEFSDSMRRTFERRVARSNPSRSHTSSTSRNERAWRSRHVGRAVCGG